MKQVRFLLMGMVFGTILVKAEVISWFRIQEMFRFHSFHMYGVIGSAVLVGIVSLQLIRYFNIHSLDGEKIAVAPKKYSHGLWIGGGLFGIGWALTGACPGPMFAQIGTGMTAAGLMVAAALFGTWTYSALREKLPH